MSFLSILSETLGWIYCLIWSSVWIPQTITNFRTKSVGGLSSQFLVLNMIGYLYYAIFVWGGTYYQHKNHLDSTIFIQDKFFATTASVIIYTMAFQTFILWPNTRSDSFSPAVIFISSTLIVLGVYNLLLGIGGMMPWWSTKEGFTAYSVLHYFGLAKSFCSLVKQVPQVLLNYGRKHTIGHNMMGPCFDLIGGVSSLLQMAIKGYLHRHADGSYNWHYFTNVPKVFLSLESIFFDTVFLTQTYVIYRSNNQRILEEQRLKRESGEEDESGIEAGLGQQRFGGNVGEVDRLADLDDIGSSDDVSIPFHHNDSPHAPVSGDYDDQHTLDGLGMRKNQPKSLNHSGDHNHHHHTTTTTSKKNNHPTTRTKSDSNSGEEDSLLPIPPHNNYQATESSD